MNRERKVVRELELPSGGGVGSASAIAKEYGVFASGGRELELRPQTSLRSLSPQLPHATATTTSASTRRRSSRSAS